MGWEQDISHNPGRATPATAVHHRERPRLKSCVQQGIGKNPIHVAGQLEPGQAGAWSFLPLFWGPFLHPGMKSKKKKKKRGPLRAFGLKADIGRWLLSSCSRSEKSTRRSIRDTVQDEDPKASSKTLTRKTKPVLSHAAARSMGQSPTVR